MIHKNIKKFPVILSPANIAGHMVAQQATRRQGLGEGAQQLGVIRSAGRPGFMPLYRDMAAGRVTPALFFGCNFSGALAMG